MKYYILEDDAENYLWLDTKKDWHDFFEDIHDGKPLQNFNHKIECHTISDKPGRVLGDFPHFWSIPVISQKAKDLLENYFGNYVQIFPLETGNFGRYYFVNVINVVNCLDKDKSKIDYYESSGRIMRIKQYTLKPISDNVSRIFKIKGYERAEIYVNENTKNLIEKNGLQGFKFTQVYSDLNQ